MFEHSDRALHAQQQLRYPTTVGLRPAALCTTQAAGRADVPETTLAVKRKPASPSLLLEDLNNIYLHRCVCFFFYVSVGFCGGSRD